MADVLSQSQIDELLSSMQNSSVVPAIEREAREKGYRNYDFNSPRKFTKDRIKMIKSVFDNYAGIINMRINGLLHASCDVSVESVEEQRYYEFSNGLVEDAVLSIAHLKMDEKNDEMPVLIHASTPLMVSMMDRMLGGSGDVSDIPLEYVYTNLDLQLYESLMKDFVSVMGSSWNNYIDIGFEYAKTEPNPTLIQMIGMDETVVIVALEIKLPNCDGRINICLPGIMLINIFAAMRLDNAIRYNLGEDSSEHILAHIKDTELEIVVEMAETSLMLKDVYNLNVGDIIDLKKKSDTPISMRIGGNTWFLGKMGVHEKQIAVEIEHTCNKFDERGRNEV